MAEVVVPITAELLEVTTGEWCPSCQLPSVVSADVAVTIGSRVSLSTHRRCTECS